MGYLATFLAVWIGSALGLLQFIQQDRVIPAEEMLSYQVGSGALALIPAIAITVAARKVGRRS